jgi:hypothetical protein
MFRTIVRRKEPTVLMLFTLAVAYGGYRAVRAAIESLRGLPRSNEDMIFY